MMKPWPEWFVHVTVFVAIVKRMPSTLQVEPTSLAPGGVLR
ncbi:MAG: hypothetical protein ACLPZR_01565 [Solirubrobacteraceae bacterium]